MAHKRLVWGACLLGFLSIALSSNASALAGWLRRTKVRDDAQATGLSGAWRRRQLAPPIGKQSSEFGPDEMVPVGLERIQQRPELAAQLLVGAEEEEAPAEAPAAAANEHEEQEEADLGSDILTRAVSVLSPHSYNRRAYDKRGPASGILDQPSARGSAKKHEFIYVVSPISEQALQFQQSKFDEGYKNFVSLAGPNYKTGLQKFTPASNGASASVGGPPLAQSAGSAACRALKSSVRLTRNQLDPATGELIRQCAGLAELNTCEGRCVSNEQPSIKALGGFVTTCTCCSEASTRRLQVRLTDCQLTAGYQPIGGQLELANHMDVQVEEPTDCQCRPCRSTI